MLQGMFSNALIDIYVIRDNRFVYACQRLADEITRARRNGSTLALLYVDLDGFKEVNDMLGHHLGDQLLGEAAQRIRKELRASHMLARQSGDEFIIALPDLSDGLQSGRVAQAILDTLWQPFVLEGQLAYVQATAAGA